MQLVNNSKHLIISTYTHALKRKTPSQVFSHNTFYARCVMYVLSETCLPKRFIQRDTQHAFYFKDSM